MSDLIFMWLGIGLTGSFFPSCIVGMFVFYYSDGEKRCELTEKLLQCIDEVVFFN